MNLKNDPKLFNGELLQLREKVITKIKVTRHQGNQDFFFLLETIHLYVSLIHMNDFSLIRSFSTMLKEIKADKFLKILVYKTTIFKEGN